MNDSTEMGPPVAFVTGGSSGVGLAVAEGLALRGWEVVIAARDAGRAAEAVRRVAAAAPSAPTARAVTLDLADPASVRACAARWGDAPLGLLVDNAGIVAGARGATAWGADAAMGVNHLGHFALTGLLLPALMRVPGARVVTVTSVVHRRGRVDPARLAGSRRGRAWTAYRASKLANLLFAAELERRCAAAGIDVTSVAAHPGLASTDLGRASAGPAGIGLALLLRFRGQSAAGGALPILFAATDPDVVPGALYGPDGPGGLAGDPTLEIPAHRALDPDLARHLWEVSQRMTGVVYPDEAT